MVLSLLLAATLPAFAQDEPEWGGGVEVDTNLRYLWRGLVFSDLPVVQPSGWLWWKDGQISLWTSVPMPGDESAIFEMDPAAQWTFYLGPVELTPALTGYVYPTDIGASTAEAGATLAIPVGPVSFYTGHSVDLIAAPGGWYGTVGIGLEQELPASFVVDAKVEGAFGGARYNDFYLGVSKTAVDTVMAGMGVGWSYNFFYVRAHGEVARWVAPSLVTATGRPTPVNVGLALGIDL